MDNALYMKRTCGAEALTLDEGGCVTPETVEGTKEDCPSKFVGKLGTVSWASVGGRSGYLPQVFLCESNESLSHISKPLKSSRDVLKVDNSVVSGGGDMQLREGNKSTAMGVLGYVLGVGDTESTFSCQPDGVVSGTQPVCELVQSTKRTCAVIVRMKEAALFHG